MDNKQILELHKKRNAWVQSTKENNFDGGIYKLLTELYPDNAHFIYELLQNAEDTGASEVAFELSKDELKFIHNGRPFNKKDIEGITSIGQGTKADDVNQIGKFGVGFKAVFSYTSSPKIFSGDYQFEINDLVVPHEIEIKENLKGKTWMIFPFNNPDKPKEKAYDEIEIGLTKLHDNTLLFLNSIKKIKYKYGNLSNTIERENVDEVRVIISNELENNIEEWLRFKKLLPDSKKLFVSVAYRISEDPKTKKEFISPVKGAVSIFFPAEKETSNLKFHIHAPFASTVARDSIKNLEENNELRDLIADLSSESLEYIRDNNLLDFNFLACLPIGDDNIPDFYEPIQDCLIDAFNNQDYIACEEGEFRPASLCFRGSKSIKKVVDTEMLKVLEDIPKDSNVFWIKNPAQKNTREDKFLQSLDIKELNPTNLVAGLKKLHDFIRYYWVSKDNYNEQELVSFLESKNNKWIKGLYELLFDFYNKNEVSIYGLKYLIKLADGTFNYNEAKCFFKSEESQGKASFNFVHEEVYEHDSNKKNQKSKDFLIQLGVKEIELKESVEYILEEYYGYNDNKEVSKTSHLNHWRLFIRYYKDSGNFSIFQNESILYNNRGELDSPSTILIDKPFIETNLNLVDGILEGYHLLNEWYDGINYRDKFVSLIESLGAESNIPIRKKRIYRHKYFSRLIDRGNRSEYTINEDYTIGDLDQLLAKNSIGINLLIWNTMKKASKKVLRARYRRIKTSSMNIELSTLIYDLMKNEWVPDEEGNFYKPCDISKEMLHDDFIYDNGNGWLTDIRFGEVINKNNEDYKQKEKVAIELSGLNPATLNKIKESKLTENEILKWLEKKALSGEQEVGKPDLKKAILNTSRSIDKNESFLEPDIVKNEDEYIRKSQEQLSKNIKESFKARKRYNSSCKVKIGKDQTREFLKNQYHGHCQICGFTFDKKQKGEKYFEIYGWLSAKIVKQELNFIEAGSSLCLCATCHSMLMHGDFYPTFMDKIEEIGDLSDLTFDRFMHLVQSKTSVDEAPEAFDFIEMDMHKISIRLLNINQQIFYTEEHFLHFFNMMTLNEDNS